MANLNIPFLLLQPSLCEFKPKLSGSKLIPYSKYNFKPVAASPSRSQNVAVHRKTNSSLLSPSDSNQIHQLRSGQDGTQQTTASLFEYGKYSNFEDTPMNLVVLGDSEGGSIVLCHEEHYMSSKKADVDGVKQKQVNKYMVSLIPRVVLVPSISEESGAVLDYALVRSPAPNILSTSTYFLVTLHEDNRLRLWNTNDGRCIMVSQKDMLVSKALKMKVIKSHPGNVMIIGQQKDVYIVNIYKMMVYKHFQLETEGCTDCIFRDKSLIVCDQKGKIYIWKDESEPSPIKNFNNASLFELNQDEYESFNFVRYFGVICLQSLDCSIGEDDELESNKVLCFNYLNKDQIFVISQRRIDLYLNRTRKTAFKFDLSNQLIFAKFMKIAERDMILVVTQKLQVLMFDTNKVRHEIHAHNAKEMSVKELALVNLNLFDDSRFFDQALVKSEDYHCLFKEAEQVKMDFIAKVRHSLEQMIRLNNESQSQIVEKLFRFSKGEMMLYSLVEVDNETKMLTWNFETLIENLNYTPALSSTYKIPMFSSAINVFPQAVENCPINFYSLVIKNIYNKHQFQFFFSDEKVTDHVIYTSQDHPCLIIGTNYGRIFMIPMFQESDERIQPIILVDQHHQSPITQLFVAYESSRKVKGTSKNSRENLNHSSHTTQKDYHLLENGGHLISLSEDGTMAVTNLNSGEIHKCLHNFSPNYRDKNRINQFFEERTQNRNHQRRNSITQCFTTNQFFYLSKVKSQSVYNYSSFGRIDRIVEVKNVLNLQEKLIESNRSKKSYRLTPDKRSEDDLASGKRRGSFSGHLLIQEEAQPNPTYACISDQGEVILVQLSNLYSTMNKLNYLDSPAIGIYANDELNQYFVICESLNIFIFNRKSLVLERKADFKFALNALMVNETIDYLQAKNESFKLAKNGQSPMEFDTFEKIFKKKSLLMGLGSHKILDYLSLSLNMPMMYHPHSIYTSKYSKAMHDLLTLKENLADYFKKEESQRKVLRVINDCFFKNNLIYKSDFNEEFFTKQCGVTCLQTAPTLLGSRQQLLLASTKNIINVLKSKMQRIKHQRGLPNTHGASQGSQFKQQRNIKGDDMAFDQEEEEKGNGNHNQQYLMHSATSVHANLTPRGRSSKFEKRPTLTHKVESDNLFNHKWPTRLLSLIHPFNIDIGVDETLEKFFGLNLPFLDFRLGIQGAEESFSFIISKEDEEYHSERQNLTKMLRLLKLSKYSRDQKKGHAVDFRKEHKRHNDSVVTSVLEFNISGEETEEPVRFFGSEYWKISSYVSTLVPTFFLSTLVSIVEYSQADITYILQEWLFILQRINQQKTLNNNNGISLSVVSKILLKKDPNISTTGRDIIMKPILYTLDTDQLKVLIDEWSQLILETYKKLKKDSSVRSAYGQSSNGSNNDVVQNINFGQKLAQGISNQFEKINHSAVNTTASSQSDKKMINHYFGELEIRGLVNISYFALYYFDQLEHSLQYRVSKLTTILTREFVQKFTSNKRYIHLLTLKLQILSIWMKNQNNQFNNKLMISEVIKLLLYIYNINKSPLNRENVITRVTGENFHLIKPTHPELYLKLSAARALLEIGENFTYDFLQIIQEEATHLNQGPEFQQNVLEILKFFINGYGENLEAHLIPLTQILLKCLDPNELALRKNSHKIISVILSIMVKMFPMVAFHHESQRLAVGTHDGPIAIYDVRTSAKWKILEGHSGNVTCLTFDSKGNLLASYSAVDLTVRLWKVGNTGFFSTIMGGTGKSANTLTLDPLRGAQNPHQALMLKKHQSVQQQDMRSNNNLLDDGGMNQSSTLGQSQTGGSKRINKCSIKFVPPKEKSVQLIREDGQVTTLKLVK